MSQRYGARLSACVLGIAVLWAGRHAFDPSLGFVERDALFSDVALQHLQDVLLTGGDWRATPLAWPLHDTITQTDWMAGEALVGLPLRLFALDPLRIYAIVSLLGLFTTAWACDRAAAGLLGEGLHTWAAGIVGGLAPAQILHAQHVNLVWHGFGPLAALAFVTAVQRGRPALAGVAGALAVLAFHFGAYVGLHAVTILGVTGLFSSFQGAGARRVWLHAAAGAGLAALTLVPVARVYVGASSAARFDLGELAGESLDLRHPTTPALDPLFQGAVQLGLLGIGAWTQRRAGWVWAAAGVLVLAPIALALGPYVQWAGRAIVAGPWAWVVTLAPPLGSLRAPARWMMVSALAASPFVAAGMKRIRTWRPLVSWVALLGLLAELPRMGLGPLASIEPGRGYELLAASPVPGPVFDKLGRGCRETGEQKLRAALSHRRPLVGGIFARQTSDLSAVNHAADGWPRAEAITWLRANGVHLVFEHPPLAAQPEGVSCEVAFGHRLCVLDP